MKNTRVSGGFEPELAADGLFNLVPRAAIILRQLVYGFPGFVTFSDNRRGNSRPNQNWPPIGDVRIDDDNLGFVKSALTSEGVKSNSGSVSVVFDTMKVSLQQL